MDNYLVQVKDLRTYFYTASGISKAVDGVSFTVEEGETLGIVGESGCGKSVMSASLMRLLGSKAGKIVDGTVLFDGTDVRSLNQNQLREFRGKDVAMIFQDPMTTLDPVFKVGYQMVEAIQAHRDVTREEAVKISVEALKKVGIPDPEKRMDAYPFELSGGMCQRVAIAMVLCGRPRLIIADEPTTALDVTMQAQILTLMKKLQEESRTAIMLITHNLGVVWEICDRVMVMYAGRIVEQATVEELYSHPMHPYTWGLMDSMPALSDTPKKPMSTIEGTPPDLRLVGQGCNFRDRCKYATAQCAQEVPEPVDLGNGHRVACLRQTREHTLERLGGKRHV